jgi:hypothetical protein
MALKSLYARKSLSEGVFASPSKKKAVAANAAIVAGVKKAGGVAAVQALARAAHKATLPVDEPARPDQPDAERPVKPRDVAAQRLAAYLSRK